MGEAIPARKLPGVCANRLELIENDLEVGENGLELPCQGRRYEVEWFGSTRKWFGTGREGEEYRGQVVWNCPVRGGVPRLSGLEVIFSGLGPPVNRLGLK